jgi:AraC family L-rhamnose operon transcriptional activator RhaR
MDVLPVEQRAALMHIVDGSPVFAGRHPHEDTHPTHAHVFLEIAADGH